MPTHRIELLDHQLKFLQSQKKFTLLLAGIGAGKSFVGSHYAINKTIMEPGVTGFIGANTYSQLQRSTLAALFSVLNDVSIPFSYNQQKGLLRINETDIICATMENYEVHRGIEIGWAWLDEARDMRREAYDVLVGRLRHKKAKRHEIRLTSSPKGYNWMFDYFAGDNKTEQHELIQAASADNEFLPDGYVETLQLQYDSKFAAQELDGKFVNISQGRIYHGFDRKVHVMEYEHDPRYTIYVGMDFNVSPMTAVIANVTDTHVYVFDEVYLKDSNTTEMAQYLSEKYGPNLTIVPDATGKALKSSAAGVSDHEILRRAGFRVLANVNPFRMDRYNSVNKLFELKRLRISNKCNKLIKDLEQVSFKQGTNLPDTSDKNLGHISDALGYLVWKTHGLTRKISSRTIQL